MKWQYEAVDPTQPPVVLLLHYRTREELTLIMTPAAGPASHAHAMMRAAAAAPSYHSDRSAVPPALPLRGSSGNSVVRNDFPEDLNFGSAANYSHLHTDDDNMKIGLRRTFSNSSGCSFMSEPVFKSECLSGDDMPLPFDRRRNHLTDIDDVPSASNPAECPLKPSPLLLSQTSPLREPLRSPLQLTSPNTFLSVPTP